MFQAFIRSVKWSLPAAGQPELMALFPAGSPLCATVYLSLFPCALPPRRDRKSCGAEALLPWLPSSSGHANHGAWGFGFLLVDYLLLKGICKLSCKERR